MKREIMKKAWAMYHAAGCRSRYEFSVALKAAWYEYKNPEEAKKMAGIVIRTLAEILTENGGKRWTKGPHDRVYLNDSVWNLLEIEDISSATGMKIAGLEISKSKGRQALQYISEGYYDVIKDSFFCKAIANEEVRKTVFAALRNLAA